MNVHEKFPLRGQIKKTPQTNKQTPLLSYAIYWIFYTNSHEP